MSAIISVGVSLVTRPTSFPVTSVTPHSRGRIILHQSERLLEGGATADRGSRRSHGVGPCIRPHLFHRPKDVGPIQNADESRIAVDHGKRALCGLQEGLHSFVDVSLRLQRDEVSGIRSSCATPPIGNSVTYGVGTPKARAAKMCPNSCSSTQKNRRTTKSSVFHAAVAPLDA